MSEYPFAKKQRLLNAGHYQAIFKNVKWRVSSKELLLLCRPNGLDHARLGLVVAKKNIRRAVQRNRLKRLIRESFRLNQYELAGLDIIVLIHKGTDELRNEDVLRVSEQQWGRLLNRSEMKKSSDS